MKRYDEIVLHALMDKYENSLLYTGQNQRNQTISVPIGKKFLPEYLDESFMQVGVIHDQLAELELKGYIRLAWRKKQVGHILEKCILCPERAEDIYRYLKRRPRREKEEQFLQTCRDCTGLHPVTDRYLNYLIQRVEQGESVKQYADLEHPLQTAQQCGLICAILENKEEVFLREFSVRFWKDSKIAEKEIAGAVGIISRFSDEDCFEGLKTEEILEECGIYRNPSWVMVKGCGCFLRQGCRVSLEAFPAGIGLSSLDIPEVCWDQGQQPKRVVTIENLTSFHRWHKEETLAIYLGGYHNRVKRAFLQRINEAYPAAGYFHFGDIDCGGFRIWKDLRAKTGIAFGLYGMDLETYRRFREYGKELTPHDRQELEKMKEDPYFLAQRELFEQMLAEGKKLEQESVR